MKPRLWPWLCRLSASISNCSSSSKCTHSTSFSESFVDPAGRQRLPSGLRERDQELWSSQARRGDSLPSLGWVGVRREGEGEGGVMTGADDTEGKRLQHRAGKKKGGAPPGPQAEPTILREGEADILLHGNDVFYNKAQVMF